MKGRDSRRRHCRRFESGISQALVRGVYLNNAIIGEQIVERHRVCIIGRIQFDWRAGLDMLAARSDVVGDGKLLLGHKIARGLIPSAAILAANHDRAHTVSLSRHGVFEPDETGCIGYVEPNDSYA